MIFKGDNGGIDYKKIITNIKKYDYISFDIFDTLIKRNFEKPTNVFEYIEDRYQLCDFAKNRIMAEKNAREKFGEITLEQIYSEFKIINKEIDINKLIDIEKDVESYCCVVNPNILPVLDYCYENKKNIVIVTDMYLPRNVIEEILNKNKIKYYKLYISCEEKCSKSDKKIFKYVLEDLKIRNNQLIHIGDNFKSDYLNPRMCGIKSIKIKKDFIRIFHYNNISNIDEEVLKFYINNSVMKDDYFYRNGFSILGPLLYCFCKWLHDEVLNNDIDNILFFSRDGLIIKKAYEKIYGENKKNQYFYISRRAVIVPSLKYYQTIDEMFDNMYLEKDVKLSKILKNLGIEVNDTIKNEALKNGVNLDNIVNIKRMIETKDSNYCFINSLKDKIFKQSSEENEAFLNYIGACSLGKKVAIVDIGWFGNMQNAIQNIVKNEKTDIDIFGYYVGLNPYNKNQKKYYMKGFLFDENNNQALYEYERRYNSIFETMFSAKHASLKRYMIDEKNKVSLIFKENDNADKIDIIERYQSGALDFVEKFNKYCENITFKAENVNILNIANDFGTNPNMEDAINWGELRFESGSSEKYIAKTRHLLKYLISPWNFIDDLKRCYWKIGFFKRVIKLKVNYNKLYDLLKKMEENK